MPFRLYELMWCALQKIEKEIRIFLFKVQWWEEYSIDLSSQTSVVLSAISACGGECTDSCRF